MPKVLLSSVMTESQKVMSKLERKDKRRAVKGRTGADADLEWLTLNGLEPLIEAEVMQRSKEQASCPHPFKCCHKSACSLTAQNFSSRLKSCSAPGSRHVPSTLSCHILACCLFV